MMAWLGWYYFSASGQPRVLLFRRLPAVAFTGLAGCQPLECGPPGVDRLVVLVSRVVCEPGTTFGAQPRTVVLAQRLEGRWRTLPHPAAAAPGRPGRPRACGSLRPRRRRCPCRRRRKGPGSRPRCGRGSVPAPARTPGQLRLRGTGDQDALDDRLESDVELDERAFGDARDLDTQICRRWRGERRLLTLRPRAAAVAVVGRERRSRVETPFLTHSSPSFTLTDHGPRPSQGRTKERREETVDKRTVTGRSGRSIRRVHPQAAAARSYRVTTKPSFAKVQWADGGM